MEEEQQRENYAFECGFPLWGDCLQAERIDYRLTLLTLHEELSRIPDALQWLELVLQGETAWQACRHVGRGWSWLCKVKDACQQVLLQ